MIMNTMTPDRLKQLMFNCLTGDVTDGEIDELAEPGRTDPSIASLLSWLVNEKEIGEDLQHFEDLERNKDQLYQKWQKRYLPNLL